MHKNYLAMESLGLKLNRVSRYYGADNLGTQALLLVRNKLRTSGHHWSDLSKRKLP